MKALLMIMAATLVAQESVVVEGNSQSAVRVIAYENLQCSDCAVYRKMMDEHLLPKYGATVAFEHRDFPLEKHKWARPAAVAARFFDTVKPPLGVEFRRWCYANMREITADTFAAKLAAWAKSNGVDPAKAVAALQDAQLARIVEADYQEGIARGVARTPTVFVNGEPFIETFTLEEIAKGIDAALETANKQ